MVNNMNKKTIKTILYDIFIKYQGLFFLLIIIDQITKIIARNYLVEEVVIFSWFKLVFTENTGVAFSLFKNAPQFVSALISILATAALEYYIIVKKPEDKIFRVLLIILAAGAFGNGIDRWFSVFNIFGYKGVVDFIFPTFFANFNVADIYVTISCIAILLYLIFAPDDSEPSLKDLRKAKKMLDNSENLDELLTDNNKDNSDE